MPGTGGPAKGREGGISRRELFGLVGATGTGLALGAGGMGAVAAAGLAREREAGPAVETHPFYGSTRPVSPRPRSPGYVSRPLT